MADYYYLNIDDKEWFTSNKGSSTFSDIWDQKFIGNALSILLKRGQTMDESDLHAYSRLVGNWAGKEVVFLLDTENFSGITPSEVISDQDWTDITEDLNDLIEVESEFMDNKNAILGFIIREYKSITAMIDRESAMDAFLLSKNDLELYTPFGNNNLDGEKIWIIHAVTAAIASHGKDWGEFLAKIRERQKIKEQKRDEQKQRELVRVQQREMKTREQIILSGPKNPNFKESLILVNEAISLINSALEAMTGATEAEIVLVSGVIIGLKNAIEESELGQLDNILSILKSKNVMRISNRNKRFDLLISQAMVKINEAKQLLKEGLSQLRENLENDSFEQVKIALENITKFKELVGRIGTSSDLNEFRTITSSLDIVMDTLSTILEDKLIVLQIIVPLIRKMVIIKEKTEDLENSLEDPNTELFNRVDDHIEKAIDAMIIVQDSFTYKKFFDKEKSSETKEVVGEKRKIQCSLCDAKALFKAQGTDLYYCSRKCFEKHWEPKNKEERG